MPVEPPGAFGIDTAIKKLQKHLDTVLADFRQEMRTSFACLERIDKAIGSQIEQMNQKLANIANTETKLGQDIQQVVDFLKNNPNPTELGEQLAKLDDIGQRLIDTDVSTLANLPPTPPPTPGKRR